MVNLQNQAADKLILQKILIMRPRANIAIFRLGISLLTAIPLACSYANQAISHTDDISQFNAAADNSADPVNGGVPLQQLETTQDETATDLNHHHDFPENNPLST